MNRRPHTLFTVLITVLFTRICVLFTRFCVRVRARFNILLCLPALGLRLIVLPFFDLSARSSCDARKLSNNTGLGVWQLLLIWHFVQLRFTQQYEATQYHFINAKPLNTYIFRTS